LEEKIEEKTKKNQSKKPKTALTPETLHSPLWQSNSGEKNKMKKNIKQNRKKPATKE